MTGVSAGRTVCVLLAAGRSERFGGDKLLADLNGHPLLSHAASMLAGIPFLARIAVMPPGAPDRAALLSGLGFSIVVNPQPGDGQGASLRIGARAAAAHDPQAMLLALGDMPFVAPAHVRALLAHLAPGDARALAFSRPDAGASWRGPPAAFAAGWLAELAGAAGDRGARPILRAAPDAAGVAAPAARLADLDTPGDFAALVGDPVDATLPHVQAPAG